MALNMIRLGGKLSPSNKYEPLSEMIDRQCIITNWFQQYGDPWLTWMAPGVQLRVD